jgi:hypothetical protein
MLSPAFCIRDDSATRSITGLPPGIIAPSVPCTELASDALTRSPTLCVFVQTRTMGRTANVVPLSILPVTGPGAGAGTTGSGAGAAGSGCGFGMGSGSGVLATRRGLGVGRFVADAGAGVESVRIAESLSCGCAVVGGASWISRVGVPFACRASLPPHAATRAIAASASGTDQRVASCARMIFLG